MTPATTDAIDLLKADHEALRQLFAEYETTCSTRRRKALVSRICTVLSVHTQIEEEIFYPAVKDALKDKLPVPGVAAEHASVKVLIAQIQAITADGAAYDAKVKVLSECVRRHVTVAQSGVYPRARSSSLDLDELGGRMAARQQDLLAHAA